MLENADWNTREALTGQGLTRRQLLVRSASTAVLAALGSVAKPYLSRAADRPHIASGIASGDVSADSAVIWARADRAARMQVECSTDESFKSIVRVAIVGSAARVTTSPRSLLLEGLPPGQDIFYRVRFDDIGEAGISGKRRSAISAPRRGATRGIVCLVGRHRRPGLGHRSQSAAACEPTKPCSKTARTSSFIPAITSTPTVRSRPN